MTDAITRAAEVIEKYAHLAAVPGDFEPMLKLAEELRAERERVRRKIHRYRIALADLEERIEMAITVLKEYD